MDIHYQHLKELEALLHQAKSFDKSEGNHIVVRIIEILVESQNRENDFKGSQSGIGYDVEG